MNHLRDWKLQSPLTNPLNIGIMKKYIAYNDKRQKAFCTYEILKTGILKVNYFMPKSGFSVIWDTKNNFCRLLDVNVTSDGRKTIVSYLLHPNYWMGFGFMENHHDTIYDAMDTCFMCNIKLL